MVLVRGVNVQGQLEGARSEPREADELAELVDLQAERLALVLQRSVRSTPGGDRGEAVRLGGAARDRPLVQHDGLADRPPGDATRRDCAIGGAQVFADPEGDKRA